MHKEIPGDVRNRDSSSTQTKSTCVDFVLLRSIKATVEE